MSRLASLAAAIAACVIPGPLAAADFAWPVVRVIDGDTVAVDASADLPAEIAELRVRLRGVDTAETGHHAACEAERAAGEAAAAFTAGAVADASVILVREPEWGAWGGRIVADLVLDGKSLVASLIEAGRGRPYDGGERGTWCAGDEAAEPAASGAGAAAGQPEYADEVYTLTPDEQARSAALEQVREQAIAANDFEAAWRALWEWEVVYQKAEARHHGWHRDTTVMECVERRARDGAGVGVSASMCARLYLGLDLCSSGDLSTLRERMEALKDEFLRDAEPYRDPGWEPTDLYEGLAAGRLGDSIELLVAEWEWITADPIAHVEECFSAAPEMDQ